MMKKLLVRNKKKMVPFIIAVVITPVFLIPLIMMILASFKNQGEALYMNLRLPNRFEFEN